jgi:phosphatidylserine/phosphatidylglycerophosphate/cardiolipin synthase-like enzyme/uncharacterized membrane protein YdjX (TVP38/TMEM64 family)
MILEQGKNCWRLTKTTKARLLIDGEAYFSQFRKAVLSAKKRIFITAWDIDSHVDLVRSNTDDGYPHQLGDFLLAVLKKNKQLHIYILLWDFSMIYAFERDWSPVFNFKAWRKHRRLHLFMDGSHPPGASHHQKIVTVDTSVAFVGGFDLSKWRWDTSLHDPDDKRRIDPNGDPYPPFHDLQFMVSGAVVEDLNDLFAQRWNHATSHSLPADHQPHSDAYKWPKDNGPEFQDIDIGIARTLSNNQIIGESEQFHIDAIRSAQEIIYIENQYFSSSVIGNEIIKRLKSETCPEIVIILPLKTGGWLEQITMDVLRDRLLFLLESADRHGKLRVYYPMIPGDKEQVLSVHSKLLIVDDTILKVGSSNLSNRSMSLDSECDLIITADDNKNISAQIQAIRQQLISEHLGASHQQYATAENENLKMISAIDKLNHGERRLERLSHNTSKEKVKDIAKIKIVDPEQPIAAEQLIDHFIGQENKKDRGKVIKKFLGILSGLIIIALLWSLTPLGDWLNQETIENWFRAIENPVWSHILYVVIFTILAVVGIPVTVLIGGVGILFGPFSGSLLAMSASVASAVVSYFIGQITGKNFIRKFAGEKINSISKQLAKRGIWTIIVVRIVPLAPYAVINMLAGASHIRLRDYVLGTIIGMLPGIVLITSFFGHLVQIFKNTSTENLLILVGLLILIIIMIIFGMKFIYQKKSNK